MYKFRLFTNVLTPREGGPPRTHPGGNPRPAGAGECLCVRTAATLCRPTASTVCRRYTTDISSTVCEWRWHGSSIWRSEMFNLYTGITHGSSKITKHNKMNDKHGRYNFCFPEVKHLRWTWNWCRPVRFIKYFILFIMLQKCKSVKIRQTYSKFPSRSISRQCVCVRV